MKFLHSIKLQYQYSTVKYKDGSAFLTHEENHASDYKKCTMYKKGLLFIEALKPVHRREHINSRSDWI